MQNRSQAPCLQPKPVSGRGGRRRFAAGRCFVLSGGEGPEPGSVQMGGRGEGARGAMSRIGADGVGRMRFRGQTILTKRRVNPPCTQRFLVVLLPPTPRCCLSASSATVSSGTQSLPTPWLQPRLCGPPHTPGPPVPGPSGHSTLPSTPAASSGTASPRRSALVIRASPPPPPPPALPSLGLLPSTCCGLQTRPGVLYTPAPARTGLFSSP